MTQTNMTRPVHMDMTLVISASASMAKAWKCLAETESDALLMDHLGLIARAACGGPSVNRVRIIACRDAMMDERPFDVSPFYVMPQELPALRRFVQQVRLTPGLRKSSIMEGMVRARYGSWTQAPLRRHVVVVATDGGAYLPQDPLCRVDAGYAAAMRRFLPAGMPPTLAALQAGWQCRTGTMDPSCSALWVITPDIEPWKSIAGWQRMIWLRCHTESIQLCDPFRLLGANVDTIRQGGTCHA